MQITFVLLRMHTKSVENHSIELLMVDEFFNDIDLADQKIWLINMQNIPLIRE